MSGTGLLYGGGFHQIGLQAIAAGFIIVYDAVGTFVVLMLVSAIVPLRASESDVEGGDLAIHGIDAIPASIPAYVAGATIGSRIPIETP